MTINAGIMTEAKGTEIMMRGIGRKNVTTAMLKSADREIMMTNGGGMTENHKSCTQLSHMMWEGLKQTISSIFI
eukprot:CAMPEP_0184437158 /NCGR_PEP_ID=MMETSP0738-20130409/581187_1 /TAXON_ID=385413 /ORGANISM="Thalassiosira miniscula, Strain CCMP1093" /LENGTH=73 /DNA_ID=CAMNT_0026804087 /DNA_START=156 /DNA_END=377 /DNA_ORIENTATION=-